MELSNASFLPNPDETMIGSAAFAWIEDGALVAFYQGDRLSGVPAARWIIGRDDGGDIYTVLYIDTRGVSRVYSMHLGNRVWELWRDAPGFSQRFTAHLSEDHNTITGSWQKSFDGTNWEHDFDVSYRRSVAG
jgi:hypothetical protein